MHFSLRTTAEVSQGGKLSREMTEFFQAKQRQLVENFRMSLLAGALLPQLPAWPSLQEHPHVANDAGTPGAAHAQESPSESSIPTQE